MAFQLAEFLVHAFQLGQTLISHAHLQRLIHHRLHRGVRVPARRDHPLLRLLAAVHVVGLHHYVRQCVGLGEVTLVNCGLLKVWGQVGLCHAHQVFVWSQTKLAGLAAGGGRRPRELRSIARVRRRRLPRDPPERLLATRVHDGARLTHGHEGRLGLVGLADFLV